MRGALDGRSLRLGRRTGCAACGAATTDPLPDDEELEAAYGDWYRPDGGGGSNFAGDAILGRTRGLLARHLDEIAPPGPILDVGAGEGTLVDALVAHGRAVTGLERGPCARTSSTSRSRTSARRRMGRSRLLALARAPAAAANGDPRGGPPARPRRRPHRRRSQHSLARRACSATDGSTSTSPATSSTCRPRHSSRPSRTTGSRSRPSPTCGRAGRDRLVDGPRRLHPRPPRPLPGAPPPRCPDRAAGAPPPTPLTGRRRRPAPACRNRCRHRDPAPARRDRLRRGSQAMRAARPLDPATGVRLRWLVISPFGIRRKRPRTLSWLSEDRFSVDPTTFQAMTEDYFEGGRRDVDENDFFVFKFRSEIDEYAELFRRLAPERIFELGVHRGGSTILFAELARPRSFVSIDLEPLHRFASASRGGRLRSASAMPSGSCSASIRATGRSWLGSLKRSSAMSRSTSWSMTARICTPDAAVLQRALPSPPGGRGLRDRGLAMGALPLDQEESGIGFPRFP